MINHVPNYIGGALNGCQVSLSLRNSEEVRAGGGFGYYYAPFARTIGLSITSEMVQVAANHFAQRKVFQFGTRFYSALFGLELLSAAAKTGDLENSESGNVQLIGDAFNYLSHTLQRHPRIKPILTNRYIGGALTTASYVTNNVSYVAWVILQRPFVLGSLRFYSDHSMQMWYVASSVSSLYLLSTGSPAFGAGYLTMVLYSELERRGILPPFFDNKEVGKYLNPLISLYQMTAAHGLFFKLYLLPSVLSSIFLFLDETRLAIGADSFLYFAQNFLLRAASSIASFVERHDETFGSHIANYAMMIRESPLHDLIEKLNEMKSFDIPLREFFAPHKKVQLTKEQVASILDGEITDFTVNPSHCSVAVDLVEDLPKSSDCDILLKWFDEISWEEELKNKHGSTFSLIKDDGKIGEFVQNGNLIVDRLFLRTSLERAISRLKQASGSGDRRDLVRAIPYFQALIYSFQRNWATEEFVKEYDRAYILVQIAALGFDRDDDTYCNSRFLEWVQPFSESYFLKSVSVEKRLLTEFYILRKSAFNNALQAAQERMAPPIPAGNLSDNVRYNVHVDQDLRYRFGTGFLPSRGEYNTDMDPLTIMTQSAFLRRLSRGMMMKLYSGALEALPDQMHSNKNRNFNSDLLFTYLLKEIQSDPDLAQWQNNEGESFKDVISANTFLKSFCINACNLTLVMLGVYKNPFDQKP